MLTGIQYRQVINGLTSGEIAVVASDLVRVLMVMDKQFTGLNTPTLQDVLEDTGTTAPTFFLAFNDLRTQGNQRFRTLYDKIHVISTEPNQNYQLKYVKYYKKMRKVLDFNGGAATATSAGKNAIWLFVFKHQAPANSAVATDIMVRLRFTDT